MAWKGKWNVRPAGKSTARLSWRGLDYLVPTAAVASVVGADDLPDLMAQVALVDGAPVITQLSITSKPHGMAVRDSHLDGLSMDKLARTTLLEMAIRIERTEDGVKLGHIEDQTSDMWAVVDAFDHAQKSRRGPSSALLQQVADIYRAHVDQSPARAVAEVLSLPQRTAARRIKQAEEAGLLPKTTPGKKRGK